MIYKSWMFVAVLG